MSKIVLHIPHSSTNIPIRDGYVSNDFKIQEELVRITDWYTDDLFNTEADDKVIAPFSRLFCDVERFTDDNLEVMSKFGMGVLYEKFDDGSLLREITPTLRKRILSEYYLENHHKLSEKVETHFKNYNECLILDCHSFPSIPLNRALNKDLNRPDFNIGTDSYHTPKHLIELSIEYFNSLGYTLGVDYPYSGSIVPMEYYQKNKRVSSIMLEVNRRLYLNEPSNEKSLEYFKTKNVIQDYIQYIKSAFFKLYV